MHRRSNPDGVRPPAGLYTHSVEVAPNARWLYIAGQTGMGLDGAVPDGIEAQSEIAWTNIVTILAASDMTVEDMVWMKTFLTRREDRDGYQAVRSRYLGDVRPASTFLIVSGLANPDFLVEVEAVAAKA
jgi:enamine deaminase RidA (YjgF/YER057c/UK114 family)